MKKRQSFTSVNQVLSKLVNKLGLDRRLKEHALIGLWPAVAGDMLAARSRPLFLDTESNLVIAVKDASTGQELSLKKIELLEKLRPLSRAVGVPVNGLRFDLKHFHQRDAKERQSAPEKRFSLPDAHQLAQIDLTPEDHEQLSELGARLEQESGASANMRDRILSVFERELRLKHWRRSSGFPHCKRCGEPSETKHGSEELCRDCYFERVSNRTDF
jgi:predicted nucleic acid-binding Zn ribbon protein